MDATRREQILEAFGRHSRRFDKIASDSRTRTGLHLPATSETIHPGLSTREQEVLALIAQGLPNGEIGCQLNVGIETVKSHVQHILQRLDARNRAHAIALAHKHGLLNLKAG